MGTVFGQFKEVGIKGNRCIEGEHEQTNVYFIVPFIDRIKWMQPYDNKE